MEVQIFGTKKCSDTRKAQRFFSERRIKTHFVDLNERPAALGELRRFAQKFGVAASRVVSSTWGLHRRVMATTGGSRSWWRSRSC